MSKLPETTPSLIRNLRQRDRQANRAANASPFSRSGTSVTGENVQTVEGILRSVDYDGTSPTDLGTTGWSLEPDGSGSSRLILNGIDVYADLAAKQAYVASLITRDASAAGFNTGTLVNDSATHFVGTPGSLSIDCPTGKLRIVAACSEASINCGSGSGAVLARLSFSIASIVAMGVYEARLYTAGARIGASLTRVKTLTVPPGTYTVSVQAGYWCSGFTAASINFADLDLSAEVVNAA